MIILERWFLREIALNTLKTKINFYNNYTNPYPANVENMVSS
jgi:hypothetical protein